MIRDIQKHIQDQIIHLVSIKVKNLTTYDMKKLPNWAKLIIVVIGLAVGYKFGYAIMDWLLDLTTTFNNG